MKRTEINTIINETLTEAVRKRILSEQAGVGITDKIKNFTSLSNLFNKITNVKNIDNGDKYGILILIKDITEDDFISCCGGSNLSDAQTKLNKNIHNDLKKNQLCDHCDVQITMGQNENNNLYLKIKILGAEPDDLTEDMKTIQKNKLIEAITLAKKQKGKLKTKPEDQFEVEVPCDECGEQLEEEEPCDECDKSLTENKKKLRMTESQLIGMIKKIVKESIPGIDAVNKAHKGDKEDADKYMAELTKKLKDYADFEGNDNPEFPNAIGKGEKAARVSTEEEDEEVMLNRGRGPQDLDYDTDDIDSNEPPKDFVDRLKKYLTGDSTTGNKVDDTLNTIKTKTGEKMFKNIEKRHKEKRKEPIYKKEPVPVKDVPENKEVRRVNEEVKRMKEIVGYNKKTQ